MAKLPAKKSSGRKRIPQNKGGAPKLNRASRRARRDTRDGGENTPALSIVHVGHFNMEDGLWYAQLERIGAVPDKHTPPITIKDKANQLKSGMRVLARLSVHKGAPSGRKDAHKGKHAEHWRAEIIRLLPDVPQQSATIYGVYEQSQHGAMVYPADRKDKRCYRVAQVPQPAPRDGDLVECSLTSTHQRRLPEVDITRVLGAADAPGSISLMSILRHEIPHAFPEEAILESEAATQPVLVDGREDVRHIPLITIDGEDARDFDDAVCAIPCADGYELIVAIADVAHYVQPDSALDAEASLRGNSVYFPDRVVPMLPEALSNGLCSLRPDEDRYCVGVRMQMNAHGIITQVRPFRGLMRSHARYTYTQAQSEYDAQQAPDYIQHLYSAYALLKRATQAREPLDFDLPEYQVQMDEARTQILSIHKKSRLDSHRLIELYMIAANVAIAEVLLQARVAAVYRVHEAPEGDKWRDLKTTLKASGYSAGATTPSTALLNKILRKAEQAEEAAIIHPLVLRAQMQAYYAADNGGHFGLNLTAYTHFTSPIRRYSDLLVHRALIHACNLGDVPVPDRSRMPAIAQHISTTERKAMMAERDTMQRYRALYMQKHVGEYFTAYISGLCNAGLFLTLPDTGAEGFLQREELPRDFYQYDPKTMQLIGQRTKTVYRIGQEVAVQLLQVVPETGELRLTRGREGKK